MKLRRSITVWLCIYLSLFTITQSSISASTAATRDTSIAGSTPPAAAASTVSTDVVTAGGRPHGFIVEISGNLTMPGLPAPAAPVTVSTAVAREIRAFPAAVPIPPGYPSPFVIVPSLEFVDRGYRSDGWVDLWHKTSQPLIAEMYNYIDQQARSSGRAPNVACAQLSLVFRMRPRVALPGDRGASTFRVKHHDACAASETVPEAAAGAGTGAKAGTIVGARTDKLLFLSGLGWGRWSYSVQRIIQAHLKANGFKGVASEDFLLVPPSDDDNYMKHRQCILQLEEFFDASVAWSRFPKLRTIRDTVRRFEAALFVDTEDYATYEGGGRHSGGRRTFNRADFRKDVDEPSSELGMKFFDSEQVAFRYFMDRIKKGAIVRELAADIPAGAILHRIVLNIASYQAICDWCGATYFWEAESRNLIANALIESLQILCPDIIIDPSARTLFIEFSGRNWRLSDIRVRAPAELHIASLSPYIAAHIIPIETTSTGTERRR